MLTRISVAGLMILGLSARFAPAAETAEIVARAKIATALVRISSGGKPIAFGSAFCLDETGVFVTNAHVADGKRDVDLVIEPGEKDEMVIPAKVLRSDAQRDLAIIQTTRGGPFTPLELGSTDALQDTTEIMAVGYPFGEAMAMDTTEFPSVSVNTGHVTSLRKKMGELQLIQVDAALNPGNSGGPVLDSEGKVIGIVQAGIPGSGVNFAIPVDRLKAMLKQPLLSVEPATLDYAKRSDPQQILVKVVSLLRPVPVYTVELTLRAGNSPPRVLTAESQSGLCRFNAALVSSAARGARPLIVSGTFPDGALSGRASDRPLHIADKQISLSDMSEIRFNADGQAAVTTADQTLTGTLSGIDGVNIIAGGVVIRPNWATAQSITVSSADQPVSSIQYSVRATGSDHSTTQLDGSFDLSGAVPANAAPTSSLASAPDGLWALIRKGVAENRVTESDSKGGAFSMKNSYVDVPQDGALLVGFNYSLGEFVGQPIINSLQPIYLTQSGQKLGPVQGTVNGGSVAVRARSGYVVTGVHIRAGGNFDGFQLVFTRLAETKLQVDDTYDGPWVGRTGSGSDTTIDTGGGLAVGIAGQKAEKFGSLGLMVLPLGSAAPAAPNSPIASAAPPDGGPPMPIGAMADAPAGLPAAGEPYRTFQQMLETLPADLQPSGQQWIVGRRVSPELISRLRGQPAEMVGEFASTRTEGDSIEVTLDGGGIDYRGFHLTGQIIAKFPAEQTYRFQNLRIHDQLTIEGTISRVVVRGSGFDTVFVSLDNCRIK